MSKDIVLDLLKRPLLWLLVMVPVTLVLNAMHASGVVVFAAAALAIIPLAGLMGEATEHLAEKLGPAVGGFLNASFGNAAELILSGLMIARGPKFYPLVKASITGSILGNVLLVLGAALFAGGLRHKTQHFNRSAASMGATLLALAAIGLLIPTFYYYQVYGSVPDAGHNYEHLSNEIAIVLGVVYLLSLLFSLVTHRNLLDTAEAPEGTPVEAHDGKGWSRPFAIGMLVAATIGVAAMSECLIGSVEEASHHLGLNQIFVGVIVVAIIGNAAEHSTAVLVAMKNKMDLALNIAIGSALQIVLFVVPALVLISLCFGHAQPLDLHFTPLEIIAIIASVLVVGSVSQDGKSNWLEGAMLIAVYVIFGIAFFHLPG